MVLRFGKSCVFGLWAFLALSSTTVAVVEVRDGGYRNVLVTFSPDIQKEDRTSVLLATKDLMTRVSSVVHKATGIHFAEVVFLLPYGWDKLDDFTYSSANDVYHNANIFIENSANTVYGEQPFTLQSGGCGSEGVRISVPKGFLSNDSSTEDRDARAKLMAREWIRYRYGVFYENGYPNDNRYPLYFRPPGSGDPADIRITDCTDKPVKYSFKDSRGAECTLAVDESGRPERNSQCSLFAEKGNSSDVLSSLMYLQDLPSVVYLCDDENRVHNADAPNKQNSLCKGRSIWSVMKNHPDFKDKRTGDSTDSPPEPNFKIILDRNPRIVLAVDSSTSFGIYTKRVIKKAVQKFMFELPEETEFSLLSFSSMVETKVNFGLLKEHSLEFDDHFIFDGTGDPCPKCAVLQGLQVLKGDTGKSEGTIVVLSSVDSSATGNTAIVNQLKSSQICLIVFVLNGSNSSNAWFRELRDAAPCSHLWTMPAVQENVALDVLLQLNEQFERVIKRHSYNNAKYTVETTEIVNESPVSFKTDRGIREFEIWLTNSEDSLASSFSDGNVLLQNGEEQDFKLKRIKEVNEFRVYQVSAGKAENWRFQIKTFDYSSSKFPILLQVVAKESNSESIRVRSWIEDTSEGESGNLNQNPVVLYAEVTMGVNPVLDAKVQASVAAPNQSPLILDLFDNGLGDPDVTRYDGIYTRYFTQFASEGDYYVTFTISDNGGQSRTAESPHPGSVVPCCGSFVPTGVKTDTGPFNRMIYNNFKAKSGRPSIGYKPSTVQDLRITSWDDSGKLALTWTSPGDEMDNGAAAKYIFKLFATKGDAEEKFQQESELTSGFTILDPVIPKDYPTEQTVQIQLSENITTNMAYFLAMRSESSGGRQSDTSNVVQIFFPAPITSSPSTTNEANTNGDGDGDAGRNRKLRTGNIDGKTIGIIVGVCILVIIILICAYIAFYVFVIRPRRKKDEGERSDIPSQNNSKDTSEDAGDGSVPASEWQMEKNNSISPVNSWPSNVLVNHHEKVKEAKRNKEKPPIFKIENLENVPEEISTISNGLLPNPIYSSAPAEDFDENDDFHNESLASQQQLADQPTTRHSRRVSHV